jgi:hypothetical protein
VLKNLPAMQPGEHMGRKVRSRFVLPVNIRWVYLVAQRL